jgi:hypothetical protein
VTAAVGPSARNRDASVHEPGPSHGNRDRDALQQASLRAPHWKLLVRFQPYEPLPLTTVARISREVRELIERELQGTETAYGVAVDVIEPRRVLQ